MQDVADQLAVFAETVKVADATLPDVIQTGVHEKHRVEYQSAGTGTQSQSYPQHQTNQMPQAHHREMVKNPDGIEDFYLVSSDLQSGRSYYETEVRQPYYPGDYCLEPARWEEYGFLNYDRDEYAFVEGDMEYWSYSLPDQETDLGDFVMVILGYEPEEFEAQYVQYPKVIEKYTLLREILIRECII